MLRERSKLCSCLLAAALSACATGGALPDNPDDVGGFEHEARGGQVHANPLAVDHARLVAGGTLADGELDAILGDRDLRSLIALGRGDLVDVRVATTATAGAPLVHVTARQQIDGIPVHGTYVNVAIRAGTRGTELASSAYHVYGTPRVDTTPVVGRDAAIAHARDSFRSPSASVRNADLAIWPLDGGLRLVWVVDLDGADRRALVRANGSRPGRVTLFDDRVFDADGAVRGHVAIGGAPGSQGVPQLLPLRDVTVGNGTLTTTTAADGSFAFGAAAGSTVTATASGVAAIVVDAAGANVSASALAGPGLALDLGATDENSLAQVTAYHFVTATRQFLIANGLPPADFGAPLVTNVNMADTCNAYFVPSARTINFFHSGGGCQNSAEASIIAHEYGHFVDHFYGGITEGGLSEGWGDTLACLMLANPIVGGDLLPGDIIRTCDNDYQFPPSGNDEVHALGQAWAGFVWHARENLIASLGEAEGDAVIRALVLPSLPSNAADIPAAVREVFLRDDDDGDLSNQTPHWAALFAAAEQHALGFVMQGDLAAPSTVTDLAVASNGVTSAVVRWTAPGDDGTTGTATAYDLRIANAPITPSSFSSATPVAAPDPIAAGGMQEATIPVPPGSTTYVALRARDEVGNQSAISNVVAVEPAPSTIVFADGAENGIGTWTASGLWHVTATRAATGTASFWYGQEATGNYNTGAANTGTLTSPIIDLAGVEQPALVVAQYLDVEEGTTWDLVTITVRDVDDAAVTVVGAKTTGFTGGVFQPRVLDLAALTGRRVQIDFAFNTVDGILNDTVGWLVDDVTIIGAAQEPPAPRLVINEVLADPPPGYDAGGDGVASTTADEFVELVNVGDGPLDLSGWTLADSIRTRLTFPSGTSIPAGGVLVVLGGGASMLPVPAIIAPGLYLNNAGDTVRIRRPDGELATERVYGAEGNQNSSLNHQIDGDPDSPVIRHVTVWGTPASPGTRGDGTPWTDTPPPPAPVIVINEILADPAPGYDASGDGVANTVGDEFLEIANIGTVAADLGGATIADAVGVRVTLPAGTTLAPGGALVVFGGGTVGLSIPGVAFVSTGTLALNNTGDTITIAKGGVTLATASYGSAGGNDQSLVRATELDPAAPFVGHTTVGSGPASPGVRASGAPL
jgi:hypothetical protein